jgi:hypothetical protein
MDIGYAVEKLSDTVRVLSTSPYSIKERLKEAVTEGFSRLTERDIPPKVLKEFKSISERLTKVQERHNVFGSSIDQMSDEEAVRLAEDIVDFDAKLNTIWNNS